MKTVFSSHSELAHAWANQLQTDGRSSNMFFRNDTIYSYGDHYEIAKFVTAPNNERVVFVNSNGYSSSTGKHTSHVWNAIPDGIRAYRVPFSSGTNGWSHRRYQYFNIQMLPSIVEALLLQCKNLLYDQMNARTKSYPYVLAASTYDNIVDICNLFDIPTPPKPEGWEAAREKSTYLRETQGERQRLKDEKELAKSKELLDKWLQHEYNSPIYNIPVHLRMSTDGKMIETSKGAKVGLEASLRLLSRLRKNEYVSGEKIDGFTVISNDEDAVKIGCHSISWPIINKFFSN